MFLISLRNQRPGSGFSGHGYCGFVPGVGRGALGAVTGQRSRREFEQVSGLCLRVADGSRDKLEHRVREETGRQAPRRHFAAQLPDSILAVQIDEVDRELHEEGVHGFTGEDPQTLTGREPRAPQQALTAPGAAVGDFQAGGKHRVASEV